MSEVGASSGFPVLEKFELVEEIGHGGMATVYRAFDHRLEREVAVKVIHKHLRENAEVCRRFASEARAVAKLRHPGIVEVYDVSGEDDAERYLVVELIRGTTLRQVLQQHGQLPAEVAAALVVKLCEAVEHAHGCGVIHRDIKPENVLIELADGSAQGPSRRSDAGGSEPPAASPSKGAQSNAPSTPPAVPIVKLTDFGIAKILDTKGVTSTGQILGSPAHMAPEQIEGASVGPQTDVFGLGVLMYECMVGHLPFEGRNPAQVLRRVLEGDFDQADSERPEVGGSWGRIVADALARDVADRSSSATELARQIREELADLGFEDIDSQINDYFADPDGYAERVATCLVPRLLERGEKQRRRGHIHAAAADFNRALAHCPNDLAILKRVSSLSAHAAWKRRSYRLGAIVLGSTLLGLVAYGVTRLLTDARAAGPIPVASSWFPTVAPPPALSPTVSSHGTTQRPPPTVTSSVQPHATPPPPSSVAGTPTAPRKVRFTITPQGAILHLDGQNVGNWIGRDFLLEPGPHVVAITIPPGSKCCIPLDTTAQVKPAPAEDPDAVQTIGFKLERRPSTVTLSGGPAGSSFSCSTINLSGVSGVPAPVVLPQPVWTGVCDFSPGGKRANVVLQAGQANTLRWPGGG